MRVLALDVATKTGWGFWLDNRLHSHGMETFAVKRGESVGMRFLRFKRWLVRKIRELSPDIIAFEHPAHLRSQAANAVLHGMLGNMHSVALAANVETYPVEVSTLKTHATGDGKAKKPEMIKAANKRWHTKVTDDNEGDALCVLAWAVDTLDLIEDERRPKASRRKARAQAITVRVGVLTVRCVRVV